MINWRKSLRRVGVALNLRDPPNVPSYGWSYFDHLVAVYVTLNTANDRADAVIKKSSSCPDDLKWGDIFLLENIIFDLLPPEVLERSAWIIRERFREISSPTIYSKYVQSSIPKDTDTPEKVALLKADLARILDVLHWYYAMIPIREHIRKSLTSNCIRWILGYTLVLGGSLFWLHRGDHSFIAMSLCVLYFGIIGGFVSSQRRMQSLPTDTDPLVSIFGLASAGYYLWLSPLLGGIFAIILCLMFVAGVLQGSVFPDFHVSHEVGSLFLGFAHQAIPHGTAEWGKLFVWSFLAGFAERLVPDSLDRLSSKLDPDKQPASGSANGNPPIPVQDRAVIPDPMAIPTEEVSMETIEDALHTGEVTPKNPG